MPGIFIDWNSNLGNKISCIFNETKYPNTSIEIVVTDVEFNDGIANYIYKGDFNNIIATMCDSTAYKHMVVSSSYDKNTKIIRLEAAWIDVYANVNGRAQIMMLIFGEI